MLAKPLIAAIAATTALAATSRAAAEGQLTIAMDREHSLFVSTTLSAEDLKDVTFGLARDRLQAFRSIDEHSLMELVTETFARDPAVRVTAWVDPAGRPMSWPAGWQADSDVLDPAAYLQILLLMARQQAGVRDVLPWQASNLTAPFPPPVPVKVGSHARAPTQP